MIHKPFAVLILFSFLLLAASAQSIQPNISFSKDIADGGNRYIAQHPGQQLTIGDFTGNPDYGRDAVAITSSGFLFRAGFRSKAGVSTLSIIVECSFDKQLSWMKAAGKNAYILEHEQHHFDISYIGALLFIKKLKQVNFTAGEYKQQLQLVYDNAINDMEQLQIKYDDETNNGLLKDKQEAWNKRIAGQLASLAGGDGE